MKSKDKNQEAEQQVARLRLKQAADAVRAAQEVLREKHAEQGKQIDAAVAKGLTWQEIGDATGYTRDWIFTWNKRRGAK